MHNITFVSTVHKEIGKCNADELCNILVKVSPDVIFLEALEDTYSKYQQIIYQTCEILRVSLQSYTLFALSNFIKQSNRNQEN